MNSFSFGVVTLFLFSALSTPDANAFPENIRHGYINCNACHVSLTGGGILTEYGRSLSKELLSSGHFFFERANQAAQEQEAQKQEGQHANDMEFAPETQFLYGNVAHPSWLNLGGDLRALQLFEDTPRLSRGRFILMQLDIEAAVQVDRVRFVGTFGRNEPRAADPTFSDYLISRRHWFGVLLGSEAKPEDFQIRLGRFFPAYGLGIAEHTIVTRARLGFDQAMETYNVEAAYAGKKFSIFATGVLGRPDKKRENREKGFALQAAFPISSTYKVGINGYTGTAETAFGSGVDSTRDLMGVWGLLGFSTQWYALVEADRVRKKTSASTTGGTTELGFVDFIKVGHEPWQGVHFFGTQEFHGSSNALAPNPSHLEAYGIGMQYFPRPHWDLMGTFRKERNTAVQRSFNSVVWLILHYSL